MAPEIFKRTGHGKPVDVWAMGVITYFLLAGYTPFDRDTQEAEMKAIIAGAYPLFRRTSRIGPMLTTDPRRLQVRARRVLAERLGDRQRLCSYLLDR